jgi:hypothetical protein
VIGLPQQTVNGRYPDNAHVGVKDAPKLDESLVMARALLV